jgi:hypothetical protein
MKSTLLSSILIFSAFFAVTTAMLASERDFLSDLLKLSNLPQTWTEATLQTACSDWEGLDCNDDHIIAMKLSKFGIGGPIPATIGGMYFLEDL